MNENQKNIAENQNFVRENFSNFEKIMDLIKEKDPESWARIYCMASKLTSSDQPSSSPRKQKLYRWLLRLFGLRAFRAAYWLLR